MTEGLFRHLTFTTPPSLAKARATSPCTGNIIKLRKWQKEDTHNKAEKKQSYVYFSYKKAWRKDRQKKSVKKSIEKRKNLWYPI